MREPILRGFRRGLTLCLLRNPTWAEAVLFVGIAMLGVLTLSGAVIRLWEANQ